MLDLRNHGQKINNAPLQYNFTTFNLEHSPNVNTVYQGVLNNFQNIRTRLLHIMNHTTRLWESHLQAYLMQELKRNVVLTNLLFPQTTITWIGNEIYCGAGMQRIDILAYSESPLNKFIHLIELKSVEATANTASQINRYIKWLKAHIPDISIHQIIPTIIAPSINQSYNDEVRIYLRGHGISQFRNITVDNALNFTQTILTV
jgi:RecB family endonuclease NucS